MTAQEASDDRAAPTETIDFQVDALPGFLVIESPYREMAARAWVGEIVLGSGEVPLTADTLSFCELMTQWILHGPAAQESKKLRVVKGAD